MDRIEEMERKIQEMMQSMDICARHAKKIAGQLQLKGMEDVTCEEGSHCFKIYIGKRNLEGIEFDTISIVVSPDRYGNRLLDYDGRTNYVPKCIEGLLSNNGKVISQQYIEIMHFKNADEIVKKVNSLLELPVIV